MSQLLWFFLLPVDQVEQENHQDRHTSVVKERKHTCVLLSKEACKKNEPGEAACPSLRHFTPREDQSIWKIQRMQLNSHM